MRCVGRLAQGALVLGCAWLELGLGFDLARLALTGLAINRLCQPVLRLVGIGGNDVLLDDGDPGDSQLSHPRRQFRRPVSDLHLSRKLPALLHLDRALACVTYYPALAILGRSDPTELVCWLAPLAGFAFLALSLRLWSFGVSRYRATGG